MIGTILVIVAVFNVISTIIVLAACAVSGANAHVMEDALQDQIAQKETALQGASSMRYNSASFYPIALVGKHTTAASISS
ncbi:MAG: hypothetical protein R2911_12265 [Caldilineaceae bacterium]